MRQIHPAGHDGGLQEVYAWPDRPWLRVNMIATVDGSAAGPDGLSGTINNEPDHQVFQLLRASADVVLVGGGTARAEGYGPASAPLVVVSGRGALPEQLQGQPEDVVRIHRGGGPDELRGLRASLEAAGHRRLLCEGGPTLLGDLLRAGLVDEICATTVPRLIAGDGRRMIGGPLVDVPLTLSTLVEHEGTLLARWLVSPA